MSTSTFKNKLLLQLARIVSYIFTPYYIPFCAFLCLFLFSYLRIMPWRYKLIILGIVYCSTIFMPIFIIYLYRKINGFSRREITTREKRFIPFILTILSYVFCLVMMKQLNIPWYMKGVVLTELVMLIVCTIANLWWKLSEHMAGMGALLAGLISFSFLFGYNPVWWLSLCIFVAGMLGSARIILKHHTLAEVLGGFFVGFVCSALVLHPMYNYIGRMFLF